MQKGIESFTEAVQKDCSEGNNCFNSNGCDKEFTKMVPQDNPRLLEMGITHSCVAQTKCMHKYCDKFKWVLDRAEHYAELLATTKEIILQQWEEQRRYWYMNYYQESNQPPLAKVKIFEDLEALKASILDKGFRCPKCNGVSTDPYDCTCTDCNWKSYGLFGTMGKGVDVLVKTSNVKNHIFFPVAWEPKP